MGYLPILDKLFSSDSFIFALIGLVVAALFGLILKSEKINIIGLSVCFLVYVIAEIASNFIIGNYLLNILLLFVGTIAIDGIIGFLFRFVVSKI